MAGPIITRELNDELSELKQNDLYRRLRNSDINSIETRIDGKKVTSFCSNDYLGLSNHPEIIDAAIESTRQFGTGSGASRLISGNHILYEELEKKLARFKSTKSSLIFSSGYLANIGVITTFAGRNDTIFCDKLSHASIVDGCILSRAQVVRFHHNDVSDLQNKIKKIKTSGKRIIITEGLFSMDGDIAPLSEISQISKDYDCLLIVDDAHGTGVLGENGKGSAELSNCESGINIQIGTLSKALGSLGGFVATSDTIKNYLINKSRPFIFTTALPPAVLAAAIKAIDLIENNRELRKSLIANWKHLRQGLSSSGFKVLSETGPIIPVLIGEPGKAVLFSQKLMDRGFYVPAIRPPAVEKGKSRLRLTVSANHGTEQIDSLMEAMSKTGKELGIIGK